MKLIKVSFTVTGTAWVKASDHWTRNGIEDLVVNEIAFESPTDDRIELEIENITVTDTVEVTE